MRLRSLLPILLIPTAPLVLALALRYGSVGPDVQTVRTELASPDRDERLHGLEWAADLQSNALLDPLGKLLDDPKGKVRERAADTLQNYTSPDSVEALEKAIFTRPDEARGTLKVLYSSSHPKTLDSLARIAEQHPDYDIRERAARVGKSMEFAVNQREGYYSLGNHVWNPLGQYLSSAGMMFPQGRDSIARGPSPGSQYPGMAHPWISEADKEP